MQMKTMSAELATHDPVVTPMIDNNGIAYVDTTYFDYDDTIYIDADSIKDQIGSTSKLYLNFKEGQTLVFNFKETTDVKIDRYDYTVITKSGETVNSDSTSESFVNS